MLVNRNAVLQEIIEWAATCILRQAWYPSATAFTLYGITVWANLNEFSRETNTNAYKNV